MEKNQTDLKKISLAEIKDKLSANDYEQFRRIAVMRCMITSACWSQWVTGKYTPLDKYKPIIDEIAAMFGYVVFGMEGGEK